MSTHPHVPHEVQRKPAESRSPLGSVGTTKATLIVKQQLQNRSRVPSGLPWVRHSAAISSQLEMTHRGKDNDTTMTPM
ncbi:hypothetical protein BCR43DRAFT_493549 [Syncephalastrum racemosum]|uniref:Uncharacterized protein n=1 Tax=Syncephalastrum racemosum TaxID=13706 RepID=A0A1X2HAQ1_SYNRA|nr:hypothetical protein BCR43DRAFT_493549 [Syncephalastrum racemosum]